MPFLILKCWIFGNLFSNIIFNNNCLLNDWMQPGWLLVLLLLYNHRDNATKNMFFFTFWIHFEIYNYFQWNSTGCFSFTSSKEKNKTLINLEKSPKLFPNDTWFGFWLESSYQSENSLLGSMQIKGIIFFVVFGTIAVDWFKLNRLDQNRTKQWAVEILKPVIFVEFEKCCLSFCIVFW